MKLFYILLFSSIAFILNSCQEDTLVELVEDNTEETYPELPENISGFNFTAPDFKLASVNSRTNIDVTENGVRFSWASNDTIGIFPNEGSQVYFPMESGTGTNTASFTGGGWALKSSSKYAAYYPLHGEFYLDKKEIPLSYVGQTQIGNGTTTHLGAYDYMGAVATIPENGNVNFEFKHLGALVQLNIPMEEECKLNYIVLQLEQEDFVNKALLDLSSNQLKVTPVEKSKRYGIVLNNLTLSKDSMIATVYFMLSPVDLSGKKISVIARSDLKSYQYEFSGKNFQDGFAYSIDATSSASASENEDAMILVTRANFSNDFTAYLPLYGSLDCYVDWGDGNIEYFKGYHRTNEVKHKYSVSDPTSFDVKITGRVPSLNSSGLKTHSIIEVKQWGRLGLTNMYKAFIGNTILKSLPDDSLGKLENVTDFRYVFSGCNSLTSIPEGLFDNFPNVIDLSYAFEKCRSLTSIPASLFDNCPNVTNFESIFYDCDGLTSIPEGLFDNCPNVTNFESTFYDCDGLTSIPEGLFDNCPNVTSFKSTFFDCDGLTSIPEGLFDNCPNVTSFKSTFCNCGRLTSIPEGLFDNCPNVTNFESTFFDCDRLTSIPEGLFDNCPNVTNFKCTFSDCISLTSIPAGLFNNNRKVTNFIWTFGGCFGLKGESPYTVIDGVKYHLYDRYKNTDLFITPTQTDCCFSSCSRLSDYDDIPSSWL